MKPYQAIIALVFVCVLAGVSVRATGPGMIPITVLSPESPNMLAEIAPFETALVWSTTSGSQVNDIVVDNFDADAYEEVAVITQNGTLFLFDEDSTLLWKLGLGSIPHAIAAIDGTASVGKEMLIGTDRGVLVIGANKIVQMNMSLPEPVYAVTGAHLDGDGLEEVVVGCDDFFVYAFEIDSTPLWSYLSNGQVRLLEGADIDSDARTEFIVASQGRRFTLLQDTGAMVFEKTSDTSINVVGIGDLTAAANLDLVYGNSNGTLTVWGSTGTLAYSIQAMDSITALQIGNLITGGRHELAIGTSAAALRIFDSGGVQLWNKTLGGQVNSILFPNIGATTNAQVLTTASGQLTLYNSTGWRSFRTNINGLTGAIAYGDLDSFGGEEFAYGTNGGTVSAYGRDFDSDRLADAREILIEGTLYNNPDTDADKLKDGEEVLDYDTNPLLPR
ncbi:MAG: hypothetical protein E4H14_06765 [Candidatus Thorarchaeota archaeon]|nr:MAG: hypothetical protein E4H14_06765 [Candidatus Thorarchaeota archaeon]